jgi:hypothetical protein
LGALSTIDQVQWKDRIRVNHEVTQIVDILRRAFSTVEYYGIASFIWEIRKEGGSREGRSPEVMTVVHLVTGKSPCGQVDFLLNPKSLRSRQKGANFGH